jgi:membrane AbrB-like protein
MRWLSLIAASALAAAALEAAGLPAGLLIGPLAAAAVFAVRGAAVEVPAPVFYAVQAIVGCMIASSLGPQILPMLAKDGPVFVGIALATVLASFGLGLALMYFRVLPGTVPIWGAAPGVATAMVLIAKDFAADYRLVAAMTYMRTLCVALATSVLALLLGGGHFGGVLTKDWFPPIVPLHLAETGGVAAVGAMAGLWLGLPAGALLGPLVLATTLHLSGVAHFQLPEWLLAPSYAVVGWGIGLRFTHETVEQTKKALLPILLSIALLTGFCALLAFGLTLLRQANLITAYLATSPGGMASVAIIAASSPVNVRFVLTLQAVRVAAVLLLGPALARFIARHVRRPETADDHDGPQRG